jgi:hypothetical protein
VGEPFWGRHRCDVECSDFHSRSIADNFNIYESLNSVSYNARKSVMAAVLPMRRFRGNEDIRSLRHHGRCLFPSDARYDRNC